MKFSRNFSSSHLNIDVKSFKSLDSKLLNDWKATGPQAYGPQAYWAYTYDSKV